MKKTIFLCAMAMLAGCAHGNYRHRGRAARDDGFESSPALERELPYRSGPGLNSTDRQIPPRGGPGGLGRPDY